MSFAGANALMPWQSNNGECCCNTPSLAWYFIFFFTAAHSTNTSKGHSSFFSHLPEAKLWSSVCTYMVKECAFTSSTALGHLATTR